MAERGTGRAAGRRRVLRRYDSILSVVEYGLVIVAATIFAAMLLAITYSVLGRELFGVRGAWTVEVSEYAMLYLTFLVAPWLLKEHGHVRLDIVLNSVPPRARAALVYLTSLVAACACVLLLWFSVRVTADYYQRDVVLLKALHVPQYLVLLAIPIGALTTVLRFVCQLSEAHLAGGSGDEKPPAADRPPTRSRQSQAGQPDTAE